MFKNVWNNLLSGLIIIIIGITIMIGSTRLYTFIIELLVFAFLIHGLTQLWNYYKKKSLSKEKLIRSFFHILFGVIMNMFPNIPLSIIPILFACYLLFNGVVKGVNMYILWKNKQNRWEDIFLCIFFLLIGITFLFAPLEYLSTLLSIIGLYLILLGLEEWKVFLLEFLPIHFQKRRFRISLPTFLDAFIPRKMLNKINRYFNDMSLEEKLFQVQKEDMNPDLEIFIHVAPHGFNQMGHMDIYFDGKVISYGNYDTSSFRLFDSIGDGILFEVEKEYYIPFCIQQSNKTLIGFGLNLNDYQKNGLRNEIDRIKKTTYLWQPSIVRDIEDNRLKERKMYSYIDLLYLETGAKIYKFKSGEFKTYFVLGRNCTLFADRIVGKSGTDILKMAGIITPGAYLDYLEHEFLRKNSRVICKTIYNEITSKKHLKKKR